MCGNGASPLKLVEISFEDPVGHHEVERMGYCGYHSYLWRRKGQPTPILDWRIPWREEPGRLQFMGLQESDMTETLILPYKYLMYLSDFGDGLSCTMV